MAGDGWQVCKSSRCRAGENKGTPRPRGGDRAEHLQGTAMARTQTSKNNGSCFSRRVPQERADSPGPSCVSMKSDWSIDRPPDLKGGNHQPSKNR